MPYQANICMFNLKLDENILDIGLLALRAQLVIFYQLFENCLELVYNICIDCFCLRNYLVNSLASFDLI